MLFFFFAQVGLIFASSRPEVSVTPSGKVATKLVKEDGSVCFYGWQCDGSQHPPQKKDSFPGSIVVTHFLSQFQGFCQESTTNNFMCKCCFLSESHLVPISWKMLAIVVFVVARSLFGSFLRYPCSQQDLANDSTAPSLWIQELLQVQQWNWNIGLIFDLGQCLPGCQKKKTWGCFFPVFLMISFLHTRFEF